MADLGIDQLLSAHLPELEPDEPYILILVPAEAIRWDNAQPAGPMSEILDQNNIVYEPPQLSEMVHGVWVDEHGAIHREPTWPIKIPLVGHQIAGLKRGLQVAYAQAMVFALQVGGEISGDFRVTGEDWIIQVPWKLLDIEPDSLTQCLSSELERAVLTYTTGYTLGFNFQLPDFPGENPRHQYWKLLVSVSESEQAMAIAEAVRIQGDLSKLATAQVGLTIEP